MFGVGASVVASIHLSQGKQKSARINVTQAVVVSSLFLALLWGVVCMFAPQVARLLGSSERLLPLAVEYMHWFLPFWCSAHCSVRVCFCAIGWVS